MATAVNIYIKDTSLTPAVISGAIVNVYDSETLTLVANSSTDSEGRVAFILPGSTSPGTSYEVRFFKLGVIFVNPKIIQVIEPVATNNDFDITGTLLSLDVATDPRCCRATGRFLDYSNRPVAHMLMRVLAQADIEGQIPKIVDGNLISPEAMNLRTDVNGFIKVDFIRGAQYWIMYSGEDDNVVQITVPDRSSVNLIDLMYPQPVSFAWDSSLSPSNTVYTTVGNTVVVTGTISMSDYSLITKALVKWLVFTSNDNDVASIGSVADSVPIYGQASGTTTVSVSVSPDLKPSRIPGYSITAPDLTVVVS